MAHFLAPLIDRPVANARLATAGGVLAAHLECAFDSASRRRGLLGRETLDAGGALVIAPCSSVHTFFMRFPIDVVFVGRDGTVLKVTAGLRPWRVAACVAAFATIELPAGTIENRNLVPGSKVVVESGE
jgi:hypothetical protein